MSNTEADQYIINRSFVGRIEELAILERYREECFSIRQSTAVFVAAKPGQGKTALACEFYRRNSDHLVYYLLCHPQAPDLYELKQFLASVFAQGSSPDKAAFELAYAKLNERYPTKLPRRSVLGSMLGLSWQGSYWENLAVDEREELQADAFQDLLSLLAQSGKTILIIDDAQWISQQSVDFLNQALTAINHPIFLLVCHRPLPDGKHPLGVFYAPRRKRFTLNGLIKEDSAALMCKLLNIKNLSDESADSLSFHSQGSPLFIEQLASYIDQVGGDTAKQLREGLKTPIELNTIIINRFNNLDPQLRHLVEIAALIGMYFDIRILQRLIPDCDEALQAGLDAQFWSISHRQIYVFYHALLRDSVLSSIDPKERVETHFKIAKAYCDLYEGKEKEAAGLLAEQYIQAGDYEKGLYFLTLDAHQQVKASRFSSGIRTQQSALRICYKYLGKSHHIYLEILFWVGLYHHYLLQYSTAEKIYLYVLRSRRAEYGPRNLLLSPYINNLGRLYKDTERYVAAESLLKKSLEMERSGTIESNVADRTNNLASLYSKTGQYELALEYSYEALHYFEISGHAYTDRFVALMQNNIAALHIKLNHLDKAEELLKKALHYRLSTSDYRAADLARVYDTYHSLYAKRGDHKRALYYLRKSLRVYYSSFGQRNLPYAQALIAVADLYQQIDNLPKAIKLWRLADSILKQVVSAKHPSAKMLKTRLLLSSDAESS